MPDAITETMIAPLALVPAILFALVRPGKRPGSLPMLSELAAFSAFGLTLVGLVQTAIGSYTGIALLGGPFALGLRADLVAASVATLVGFIGWIVMRYSRTYLDGEAREGAFHALMLTTLAAVLVFVQAGTLPTMILAAIAVADEQRLGLGERLEQPAVDERRRVADALEGGIGVIQTWVVDSFPDNFLRGLVVEGLLAEAPEVVELSDLVDGCADRHPANPSNSSSDHQRSLLVAG